MVLATFPRENMGEMRHENHLVIAVSDTLTQTQTLPHRQSRRQPSTGPGREEVREAGMHGGRKGLSCPPKAVQVTQETVQGRKEAQALKTLNLLAAGSQSPRSGWNDCCFSLCVGIPEAALRL